MVEPDARGENLVEKATSSDRLRTYIPADELVSPYHRIAVRFERPFVSAHTSIYYLTSKQAKPRIIAEKYRLGV